MPKKGFIAIPEAVVASFLSDHQPWTIWWSVDMLAVLFVVGMILWCAFEKD